MKILTWNCNGAFKNKYQNLEDINADILIIQECENPDKAINSEYKKWASNYLWIGDNKNKGLGVFAEEGLTLKKTDLSNQFNNHFVKYFLPFEINDKHKFLAVWNHKNNSPNFGYIGQLWKYLQVNKSKLNDTFIIGDFNSNSIWDEWDRWWNHTDVVNELKQINIESTYHYLNNEEQGKEKTATFYLYRNIEKGYHIDYCFMPTKYINNIESMNIKDFLEWKSLSDHCPIVLNLNIEL